MIKRIYLIMILLVSVTLASVQMKSMIYIKGNDVGFVLLNDVIIAFEGYNPEKEALWDKRINITINKLLAEAISAKSLRKIDDEFFERYRRILYVIKLTMMIKQNTDDNILNSMIIQQISRFEDYKEHSELKRIKGFASIAGALAEELINLKKYLDFKKNTQTPLTLSEYVRPKLKHKFPARYPKGVKPGNSIIKIRLEVVLDTRGNIIQAQAIQGDQRFFQAAVEAVKQYKYHQFLMSGKPRAVKFIETVVFKNK